MPITLMRIANNAYVVVLFPMINMIVEKKVLGIAFELGSSLMNIRLAIEPIIVEALAYP